MNNPHENHEINPTEPENPLQQPLINHLTTETAKHPTLNWQLTGRQNNILIIKGPQRYAHYYIWNDRTLVTLTEYQIIPPNQKTIRMNQITPSTELYRATHLYANPNFLTELNQTIPPITQTT